MREAYFLVPVPRRVDLKRLGTTDAEERHDVDFGAGNLELLRDVALLR